MKKRLLLAGVILLVWTGCSRDEALLPGPDEPLGRAVALQLQATVEDIGVSTRQPFTETAFPDGTTTTLGIAMMQNDGTTPYTYGSEGIECRLTMPWQWWQFEYANDVHSQLPKCYVGAPAKLWGFYPYGTSDPTAVPFDLSASTNQIDLLYSPEQTITATNADPATKNITMNFKHAHALLELTVRQEGTNLATMNKVEIKNKSGKSWVVNKGKLNPQTGTISNTTAGTVAYTFIQVLTNIGVKIRVLVPAFNDATYADGDIEVQFTDADGKITPKPFPIKKEYLSGVSGKVGLTAGHTYSFKLLYEKEAFGKLTLENWTNTFVVTEAIGSRAYMFFGDINGAIPENMPDATTNSYNLYGVWEGNSNGGYQQTAEAAYFAEKPYYRLEVAKTDEGNRTWMNARNACWMKTTDMGGWRLPRLSEVKMMYHNKAALERVQGFTKFATGSTAFWSSTEYGVGTSWSFYFSEGRAFTRGQPAEDRVRCVREVP